MLNIRVRMIDQQEREILINRDVQDSSIIQLESEKARLLLLVMTGCMKYEGDIVLNYISMRADREKFNQRVSYFGIDAQKEFYTSLLTVDQYLNLFAVVQNVSLDELYLNRKEALLMKMGLEKKQFELMANLMPDERVKVQYIGGFMKQPQLIIVNEFFELVQRDTKRTMIELLEEYLLGGAIGIIINDKRTKWRKPISVIQL
ncbi:hypothetical protein lbkm_2611 [Lachnospiraceae bacterium KM106-2]|nr:hypothetical protein lbkm_2611 [Lachnospiraceae bacterium KM106-2]